MSALMIMGFRGKSVEELVIEINNWIGHNESRQKLLRDEVVQNISHTYNPDEKIYTALIFYWKEI